MGAGFRLCASYPVVGLRAGTRAVLAALKAYGALVADNGGDWFLGGKADDRWPTGLLGELKAVPASPAEAVDASLLLAGSGSGQAGRR